MSSALFHRHNLIYYDLGPKYTVWNIKCSLCFYKSTRLTSIYKAVFVKHTDFKYLFNIKQFSYCSQYSNRTLCKYNLLNNWLRYTNILDTGKKTRKSILRKWNELLYEIKFVFYFNFVFYIYMKLNWGQKQ